LKSRHKSFLALSPQSLKLLIDEVQKKKASIRFNVNGYSMMPFIQPDDTVTIVPSQTRLDVGDIAIFSHSKTKNIYIHRIIGKRGNKFLLKGDNNFACDGYIALNNIFGMVENVKRGNQDIVFGIKKGQKIVALFSRLNLVKIYFFLVYKYIWHKNCCNSS